MLRQRVVTGIVAAAIVVTLVLQLPASGLAAVFGLLVVGASLEWAALSGVESAAGRYAYAASVAVLLGAAAWFLVPLPRVDVYGIDALLSLAVFAWLLGAVAIVCYPRGTRVWGAQAGIAYMGYLVLVPAWVAIVYLRVLPHGPWLVIYAIALIAMADIGAFFSGRALGGPKLMPRVSPAKTWSGFGGGMLASSLLALLVGWQAGFSGGRLACWVALGLATAVVSVIGDLLESMVKRHGGVKDSGSLLPGHGGLLDRLDSLSAGLPLFALGLLHAGNGWHG